MLRPAQPRHIGAAEAGRLPRVGRTLGPRSPARPGGVFSKLQLLLAAFACVNSPPAAAAAAAAAAALAAGSTDDGLYGRMFQSGGNLLVVPPTDGHVAVDTLHVHGREVQGVLQEIESGVQSCQNSTAEVSRNAPFTRPSARVRA